jgi:ComF family protein
MSHNNCTVRPRSMPRLDECPTFFGILDVGCVNACYLCDELSNRYICQSCESLCVTRKRDFLQRNLIDTGLYPQLTTVDFDNLLVLDWYQYPWTVLIPLLKFHQQSQIGKILGTWFVLYRLYPVYGIVPAQHLPEAIIPIPLHAKRERQRGYNQAHIVAQTIGELSGIPVVTDAVIRSQYTKAQSELDREHRLANVAQAFSVSLTKLHAYAHVVLVDDVLTTGSTLNTVCNAIYKQYPHMRISVWCMTIAVDDAVVEAFYKKRLGNLN